MLKQHIDYELLCNMVHNIYNTIAIVFDANETVLASSPYLSLENLQMYNATNVIQKIFSICEKAMYPQIYSDEITSVWAGIPIIDDQKMTKLLIIGPIFTLEISEKVISEYGLSSNFSVQLKTRLLEYKDIIPIISYQELLRVVRLVYFFVYGEEMDTMKFGVATHQYTNENVKDIKAVHHNGLNEGHIFHASYPFEKGLLDCVREGNTEKLFRHLNRGFNGGVGRLSIHNPIRQLKNSFICITTLVTRAAVEGGLSSEVAYSLSDLFIQQVEEMNDCMQINMYHSEMMYEFTRRVKTNLNSRSYSKVISNCCDYINEHVRENIQVTHLAQLVNLSVNYISLKFKEETGSSITKYIKVVKISEAKSLLRYSELSLVDISELLSFSSQSYFTTVFKSETGITPKHYREQAN